MTAFEQKICEAFLSRFTGAHNSMRLRSVSIFPDFETAGPDEKMSYLEAAETLGRKGIITLKWEKYHEGEKLKTLTCLNMEKLFLEAGAKDPKAEAAGIRAMIQQRLPALERIVLGKNSATVSFLNYLADHFSPQNLGRGMNIKAAEDFVTLLEFLCKRESAGGFHETCMVSLRALSVKLFNNSKRLERIIELVNPLLSQIQKQGQSVPDISFLERSFPETMISGKLVFEYQSDESDKKAPPLVNATGLVLGFPLSSVCKIVKIKTLEPKEDARVLTVENKETFYAFASSQPAYDCILYTGGYPNRAAAALIKILSLSGFCFYHAGDLDPDGILILQNIHDLARKPVTPVGMDAAAFDRYLPHARPLNKTILRQSVKIRDDTKAVPGIAELLRRILETEMGVEQEVVEY